MTISTAPPSVTPSSVASLVPPSVSSGRTLTSSIGSPRPNYKNIVVIGASVAGHNLVNTLAPTLPKQFRILLIERNSFALHAPIVVRALVVPGWEHKEFTAPITQETIFPHHKRHRVIAPNTVLELREHSIIVEHPFEDSHEIFFEKCIMATGAQQPLPIRPSAGSALDDWRLALQDTQDDIKEAQSILIVGGGSVGIEVAGEIHDMYPKKKITIVHWDTGLLHPSDTGGNTAHTYVAPRTSPKLGLALAKQLAARGVELILCDRVDFQAAQAPGEWGGRPGLLGKMRNIPLVSGRSVSADFVFNSTGNRPNSQLVREADPSALTTNGYISVDGYFRVRGNQDGPLREDYFAIGDVANAPSWKTGVAAQEEGRALGQILDCLIAGRPPKKYTPSSRLQESCVLLGSNGGAAVMRLPLIGSVRAPSFVVDKKSQDFLAGKNFFARFQGAQRVTQRQIR